MRALVDLVVRNRKRSAIIAAALIASVGAGVAASDKDKRAEWRHYLGAQDSASYSTLNQINRSNVSGLEVVWTYKAGANNRLRFNPIVVDDVMYVLGKDRAIVALDAATGKAALGSTNTIRCSSATSPTGASTTGRARIDRSAGCSSLQARTCRPLMRGQAS